MSVAEFLIISGIPLVAGFFVGYGLMALFSGRRRP